MRTCCAQLVLFCGTPAPFLHSGCEVHIGHPLSAFKAPGSGIRESRPGESADIRRRGRAFLIPGRAFLRRFVAGRQSPRPAGVARRRGRAPIPSALGDGVLQRHLCDSASAPILRCRHDIPNAGIGRLGGAGARPKTRAMIARDTGLRHGGPGNGQDLGCSTTPQSSPVEFPDRLGKAPPLHLPDNPFAWDLSGF